MVPSPNGSRRRWLVVAIVAGVVLVVAAIAVAVTRSDSSPNHSVVSSAGGSTTSLGFEESSTSVSGATAPGATTGVPATNADGTPQVTDTTVPSSSQWPVSSSPGRTAAVPATTIVKGAPLITNDGSADASMGATGCPHALEPVHADVTPTDGVTVALHWTDPEGIEGARLLKTPASGTTYTSTVGPFSAGSVMWWFTASDSRGHSTATIHHLIAVDAC